MKNLIRLASILTLIAASTGNLPRIVNKVRKAQIILIQDSKASKWPSTNALFSR